MRFSKLLLLIFLSLFRPEGPLAADPAFSTRSLVIDGGGVAGVVSLRLIEEIEKRSGYPIQDLFDEFVGVSTGAIVGFALSLKNQDGAPQFSGRKLKQKYLDMAPIIFKKSIWRDIKSGWGLWGPRYSRDAIDAYLLETFKDVKMQNLLKPVLALSYDINEDTYAIWDSRDKDIEIYVRDIIGASTAAPTKFPAKKIMHQNKTSYHIDGSILFSNPTQLIFLNAQKHNGSVADNFVVSLENGNVELNLNGKALEYSGVFGWLTRGKLIPVILGSSNKWITFIAPRLFGQFYHLSGPDIKINQYKIFDGDENYMKSLLEKTEAYIKENTHQIDQLVKVLVAEKKKRDRKQSPAVAI